MEVFIMSMVVRTNAMALNANNALNKNNSTVAGNLEKLSSGFRINRAADDASGLAISEKMKAQIKALDQASKNAEDGASLIKTAEGYMGEVHDMLNRIVELAEKSANGTFETLKGEDGKATTEAYGEGKTGIDRQALQDEVDQLTTEIDRIAATANFNELKLMNGDLAGENGLTLQIGETSNSADKLQVSIKSFATKDLLKDLTAKATNTSAAYTTAAKDEAITGGLTVDVSNQTNASKAAEEVRKVINDVSAQRANLGAMENRLDYTINNLTTASENITDANSRIRDTDMAKTMMQYTQGNVLTQAAQAMLAQANQAPSQVLQLLQ
jgi:flagellin